MTDPAPKRTPPPDTPPPETPPVLSVDARLPQDMALACEAAGAAKAARNTLSTFVLAVLAGAFIAFGAIFMTVTVSGAGEMPFGVTRLLGGLVFSLGLILVVIGGAELFTGDNLMVMAWAGGRIGPGPLARVWAVVFVGNFVGAVGTAVLAVAAGHYLLGGGLVGKTALAIASAKAALPWHQALFLGILCNALVCLAVWLTFSARTVAGKVAVIVPPIAAFVAAGFEHSIANMYFLPFALLIEAVAEPAFWQAIGATPASYAALTVPAAVGNITAVTVGNMIGGGVLVGVVYWFVYLRRR